MSPKKADDIPPDTRTARCQRTYEKRSAAGIIQIYAGDAYDWLTTHEDDVHSCGVERVVHGQEMHVQLLEERRRQDQGLDCQSSKAFGKRRVLCRKEDAELYVLNSHAYVMHLFEQGVLG